uniref:Floricaula/leafy-like transcription factor n=1 Tax=Coleochaete scutata TaxID=3125 RepID=W8EMY9_COLSC|nr:CsLFY [Coleochaete scutata]
MANSQYKNLDTLFHNYGLRPDTLAVMNQMGFTVSTLCNMTEQEIDIMVKMMVENLNMDLLQGEKFGIKAAIRSERRQLEEAMERSRVEATGFGARKFHLDEEPVLMALPESTQMHPPVENGVARVVAKGKKRMDEGEHQQGGSVDSNGWRQVNEAMVGDPLQFDAPVVDDGDGLKKKPKKQKRQKEPDGEEERPREHPFVVTEPGEAARGKKNGLDYLFQLYEESAKLLIEIQQLSLEKGEKVPTKVTNQVFRHAKQRGMGFINKPKMRQYVHCYALHCIAPAESKQAATRLQGAWRKCWPVVSGMLRATRVHCEGPRMGFGSHIQQP